MSRVSTVYDAINTALSAQFSTHTRIPLPESIEDNSELFLRKGFGIKYNGASKTDGEFCNYVFNHNFSAVFSREFFHLDSDTAPTDIANKELLEDAYTFQNYFYKPNEISAADSIRMIDLGEVSGIESVQVGKNNFKSIEVSFTVMISETY